MTLPDCKTAEQIAAAMVHQNEPQVCDFRTDGLIETDALLALARDHRSDDIHPPVDMELQSKTGYPFCFLARNRERGGAICFEHPQLHRDLSRIAQLKPKVVSGSTGPVPSAVPLLAEMVEFGDQNVVFQFPSSLSSYRRVRGFPLPVSISAFCLSSTTVWNVS